MVMKEIKHNIYLTPTVKTVAFRVERGFEGSGDLSTDTDDQSFQDLERSEAENAHADNSYF